MKKYLTLIIVLLFTVVQGVWAQTDFGNVPDTVDPNDATITKMGHMTMTMGKEVVVDPQTQQVDTIIRVKKVAGHRNGHSPETHGTPTSSTWLGFP